MIVIVRRGDIFYRLVSAHLMPNAHYSNGLRWFTWEAYTNRSTVSHRLETRHREFAAGVEDVGRSPTNSIDPSLFDSPQKIVDLFYCGAPLNPYNRDMSKQAEQIAKVIDLGNGERATAGIFSNPDGSILALTYTASKTFKTEKGARAWLARRGFEL